MLPQKVYQLVVIPVVEAPIYLGFISKEMVLCMSVSEY